MAKELASDAVMGADKLRPLLALARKEPVSAAVALTADGDGLILLDRKVKPKKVATLLRASASKAGLQLNSSSIRFGRARIDSDTDAGTVLIAVNKEAAGKLRMKLTEVVKRCSVSKVEFTVDEALEAESDEAEGESESPPEGGIPPAPPPPVTDLGQMRRELAGLVGQIKEEGDPERRARLAQLANGVNAALKDGDADACGTALGALRAALAERGGEKSGAEGLDAAAVRQAWDRAWSGWIEASDAVDMQVDMLARLLRATGDSDLAAIAEQSLPELLAPHRNNLVRAAMQISRGGAADLPKALASAQKVIGDFGRHLASSQEIAACDTNEFGAAVTIRPTLGQALRDLAGVIRENQAVKQAA